MTRAPPSGHRAVRCAPRRRLRALRVALVGNPNAGKSTLFNALTGRRQHVANFPGVTVEHAEGAYVHDGAAVDGDRPAGHIQRVAAVPRRGDRARRPARPRRGVPAADVIVVVVDAVNLERNLFFASQILDSVGPRSSRSTAWIASPPKAPASTCRS